MLRLSSNASRFTFSTLGLGITLALFACSDDDSDGGAAAGAAGQPAAGAGGGGGSAGAAGASGAAGSGGTGGAAGAAGASGAAGAAGASGAAGAAGASGSGAEPDAGAVGFVLSSPAFAASASCGPDEEDACSLFPADNTGLNGARDVSPELNWTGTPSGTQSFAIALHDLSNLQQGDPFTHWAMWNIPGGETGLPAELPRGNAPGVPSEDTRQVAFRNDNGFAGSGACGNVYEFVLYALDTPSFAAPDVSGLGAADAADAVEAALEASDAVLDTARLRARSDPAGPGCN
jgi:phosphatidylethanolamine-binding protein (PEBP) family uncharacterized protein